jgi:GxxExxY protein
MKGRRLVNWPGFAAQKVGRNVRFDGVMVGGCPADLLPADLLPENAVIVEPKTVNAVDAVHSGQWLNYLAAAGLRSGLLFNFARPRIAHQRRAIRGLWFE